MKIRNGLLLLLMMPSLSFISQSHRGIYSFYDTIYNAKGLPIYNNQVITSDTVEFYSSLNLIETDFYQEEGLKHLDEIYEERDAMSKLYRFDSKGELIAMRLDSYDNNDNLSNSLKYSLTNEIMSNTTITRDDKGNIIEIKNYKNRELSLKCFLYEYNGKGNVIKMERYNYFQSSKLVGLQEGDLMEFRSIYEYDSKGNLIKLCSFEKGELTKKTKYNYDKKNRKIKKDVFYNKGKLNISYLYKYDNKNNVIEAMKLNHTFGTEWKEIRKYDKNGYKIEWAIFLDPDEKLEFKSEYIYDNKNNLIKVWIFNSERLIETNICNYDENNDLIEVIKYAGNNIKISTDTYVYKNNEVVGHTYNDSIMKQTESYDSRGNLTEATFYDINQDVYNKILKEYDENENLINWKTYRGDIIFLKGSYVYSAKGRLMNRNISKLDTVYSYWFDNKGSLIETSVYDNRSILIKRKTWEYDDKDNLIEVKAENCEEPLSVFINKFRYDSKERLIERIDYYIGKQYPESIRTKTYDECGNLISGTYRYYNEYGEEVNISSYRSYDDKGFLISSY